MDIQQRHTPGQRSSSSCRRRHRALASVQTSAPVLHSAASLQAQPRITQEAKRKGIKEKKTNPNNAHNPWRLGIKFLGTKSKCAMHCPSSQCSDLVVQDEVQQGQNRTL